MDEGLSSAVDVPPEVYLSSNGDMPRPESKSKIEQRPRVFSRR